MDQINDKIIKDYILGRCSAKRLEQLYKWANASEDNAKYLFQIMEAYHTGQHVHFSNEARVQRAEINLMRRIEREEQSKKRHRSVQIIRYAAAAVLILCLSFVGMNALHNSVEMMEIATLTDGIKQVVLPDGSKVWLNTNSTLRYPATFSTVEREVELEGEAYFVIAKDSLHPFIVKSEAMTAQVLGTTFNFNTRPNSNTIEVALIEGRVKVSGNHNEGMITLRPNQKAVLNKASQSIEVIDTYTPVEAVWHNHMIPFNNMRITEIMTILEKLYSVNIQIAPALHDHSTYSGLIRCTQDIDSILQDLSYSIPFKYSHHQHTINLYTK